MVVHNHSWSICKISCVCINYQSLGIRGQSVFVCVCVCVFVHVCFFVWSVFNVFSSVQLLFSCSAPHFLSVSLSNLFSRNKVPTRSSWESWVMYYPRCTDSSLETPVVGNDAKKLSQTATFYVNMHKHSCLSKTCKSCTAMIAVLVGLTCLNELSLN